MKEDICPHSNDMRKLRAEDGTYEKMHTTQNTQMYGDKEREVHIMTYSEFGHKILYNDDSLIGVNKIFCDEIHSLPEYRSIDNDEALSCALRYLFQKYEGREIYYFTATDDNLRRLDKNRPGLMGKVKTFDYREHNDIVKYMDLSKYEIHHIEQIRPHLKARASSFKYFGHKGLAFSKRIEGQKRIEEILIEEGFNPLVLWSDNNDKYTMSASQLEVRDELIRTNKIPDPYNFLIINSAMREGWDLKDPRVTLAIMNTTDNTDTIQARGRIRSDLDLLIYRIIEEKEIKIILEVPPRYIDKPLTTSIKNTLCKELNVINSRGSLSKWATIKGHLFNNGYEVFEAIEIIHDKRTRVSYITKVECKEDCVD